MTSTPQAPNPLPPPNGLSIHPDASQVGVDITDQTPQQLTDDLNRAVDRVIVLPPDAQVAPIDGTPVEIWVTDEPFEPFERGIDVIERMRLVRDDITRQVERLAR